MSKHDECYEEVSSPLEIATAFLELIKPRFPDEFDPSNKFFIKTGAYSLGEFSRARLAATGDEVEVTLTEDYKYQWGELVNAGYREVCDGKRPYGGSLERFLAAYWAIADDWPKHLMLWCAADWLRIGLLMGGAMHELREVVDDDFIAAEDWWGQ